MVDTARHVVTLYVQVETSADATVVRGAVESVTKDALRKVDEGLQERGQQWRTISVTTEKPKGS